MSLAPDETRAGKRGSVSFEQVSKSFGAFTAIPGLSLEIAPGTLVTLLGPSGCGKTTTLRMLAGLEHPTGGRIRIGGKDVTALPANARDVSMVFQSYALFPHMTSLENVAYGLRSSGVRTREARERAEEGLKLVGLGGMGARLPAELSGGQQQRVAVARALALEPQVLLLDEPLSNLDARLRRRVRTEIREIQQRLGFTAVYVTHDQDEALAVSDQIIVMKEGRIAQQGTPRELYDSPASAFIADFMGEANVLPCTVEEIAEGAARMRLGGLLRRLPAPAGLKPGAALLAIRPNAVALSPSAPENAAFPGRVESAAYLGDHVEYEVATAAGRLFAVDSRTDSPISPGTAVAVDLKPRGVALLPG
ncbi:ABC transporter ATP-binding protein [Neomegalonema sp.]|uniref:ABC transporter ATP-binding protein n=1 Tax=Neomegalonema sp. TaxID=2039713 RepID=UPI0026316A57|nr:ABC transporter ATP-binding protein [Neomegalonema sp.]MDD2867608.1 ABC transporter ATP-binding protein [Neomegalonema sp.]